MDKAYLPEHVEQKWYNVWEKTGYFTPTFNGKPFCIMLPPPNITGTLHMGHAFQDTLMDILIRYHRMKGDNTLWQVGTDHAGIATQMVVERQLNQQGIKRETLGRDAFVKAIWAWKENSGGTITQQLRRLGASLDWSTERFTLDADFSQVVTQVFVQLYEEGLIYQGYRLVNWDPVLKTALSDLEVIIEEEQGTLWFIRYPLTDNQGVLTVATTRPETLLGDVAVAVHPHDERYQKWIGKTVLLPIVQKPIPIIADDSVDASFGTGCVKITPAHDFNDYEIAKRHHLSVVNIFTESACLNNNVPEVYRGLDRYQARSQVLEFLKTHHLLEKEEAYLLKVPRGDRSGIVVEPYLTKQWYVKVAPLAEPAIQAVRQGKIRFVPAHWEKTYDEWMRNIQDWCISRQIWWGHRIPAWYDEKDQCYVAENASKVREKFGIPQNKPLTQDPDVLDTWFSSALWPFVTLGWPEHTKQFKAFYPTSVLVTGFDIIFFWVARMIMMGLKLTGEIPFKEVYIHGLLRDSDGHKMSKSKGNIIDPIDLVDGISLPDLIQKRTQNLMRPTDAPKIAEKTKQQFKEGIPPYGSDALRFTYAALASTGRDIRFDINRLAGYRNFCNKLWNAARYVKMHMDQQKTELVISSKAAITIDRWIISKYHKTIAAVTEYFQSYRFDLATQSLHDFVWHEYCDWYIEFSKNHSNTEKTLVHLLENILRLLHPIMPFITEEIWQHLGFAAESKTKTIVFADYPIFKSDCLDNHAEIEIEWLKSWILGIRNIRGEMNISPKKLLSVFHRHWTPIDKERVSIYETDLKSLAKIESISWLQPGESIESCATALVGDLELLIPLANIVDIQVEVTRLQKEIQKLQSEIERSSQKLANPEFKEKAPFAAVSKEQEKLKIHTQTLQKLEKQQKKWLN